MKILFKPIITAVCLLLTMSAFGQESLAEKARIAAAEEALIQKNEAYIQDAYKGLESLGLDHSKFSADTGDYNDSKVFLESNQYSCQYHQDITGTITRRVNIYGGSRNSIWKIVKYNIIRVYLSCLDKETKIRLGIDAMRCFSCD